MLHQAAQKLLDHWQDLAAHSALPGRHQLDPLILGSALPALVLADIVSPDYLRLRLAGSRLCTLYGREMRGTNLLDLWRGDCRRTLRSLIGNLHAQAVPAHLNLLAHYATDTAVPGDLMLLPLADRFGGYTHIAGALSVQPSPHARAGLPPNRLEITGLSLANPGDLPGQILRAGIERAKRDSGFAPWETGGEIIPFPPPAQANDPKRPPAKDR